MTDENENDKKKGIKLELNEFMDRFVEITIENKNGNTFIYHGKFIEENENYVILDDVKDGKMFIRREKIITCCEMNQTKQLLLSENLKKLKATIAIRNPEKILTQSIKSLHGDVNG